MGLNEEQMVWALGLAASQPVGLRSRSQGFDASRARMMIAMTRRKIFWRRHINSGKAAGQRMQFSAIVPAAFLPDASKIRAVHHDGPHYRVSGIHLTSPSPQRTPLLYQAGASKRRRSSTRRKTRGSHLSQWPEPNLMLAEKQCARSVQQRKSFGRSPYDIRLIAGLNVVVKPTRSEAKRSSRRIQPLCRSAGATGAAIRMDQDRFFTLTRPDQALQYVGSNAIQSMVENLTKRSDKPMRIGDLASLSPAGARAPFVDPAHLGTSPTNWPTGRARPISTVSISLQLFAPESLAAFVDLGGSRATSVPRIYKNRLS